MSLLAAGLVLSLAVAGCQTRPGEAALVARVVRIKGAARTDMGTGQWQPLTTKSNSVIQPGWLVQTAADSYFDVSFGEWPRPRKFPDPLGPQQVLQQVGATAYTIGDSNQVNVLRIQQDTTVQFEQLVASGSKRQWHQVLRKLRFQLRAGRLMLGCKSLPPDVEISASTQDGTVRVLEFGDDSTVIAFSLSSDGTLEVFRGKLEVRREHPPQTLVVKEDQVFHSATGQVTPRNHDHDHYFTYRPLMVGEPIFRLPRRNY